MRGTAAGVIVQLLSLVLAPLLPGTIQSLKARLQGRRGPSPLQPYRELRRLWGKTGVAPFNTTFLYRTAPSLVAASLACALLIVPVGASTLGTFGTDMLLLVGLVALARFAITAAAWDPGGGFPLMGAGRDLMFSVFAEPLLLLALLLVAAVAHSTDLVQMSVMSAGALATPAHWTAALAFLLVVFVETGRQPIDNPDTHLELTMVHEGPLLEYAGRDLAMLQWSAAARHWLVLVLAADLFLPLPATAGLDVLALAGYLAAACALLALAETSLAKMRILRVPSLLGMGVAVGTLGVISLVAGVHI